MLLDAALNRIEIKLKDKLENRCHTVVKFDWIIIRWADKFFQSKYFLFGE